MIRDPESGHQLLFIEVPDAKQVKNRIHFDLRPRSGTRDEEVERVLALGATEVADLRGDSGPAPAGWCSPTPRATSSASCGPRRAVRAARVARRRLPISTPWSRRQGAVVLPRTQ